MRLETRGISELVGIDPLLVANEGKAVMAVRADAAERVLARPAARIRSARTRRSSASAPRIISAWSCSTPDSAGVWSPSRTANCCHAYADPPARRRAVLAPGSRAAAPAERRSRPRPRLRRGLLCDQRVDICRGGPGRAARRADALASTFAAFYDARQAWLGAAPDVRAAFDADTARLLKPFSPDLVVLDGISVSAVASRCSGVPPPHPQPSFRRSDAANAGRGAGLSRHSRGARRDRRRVCRDAGDGASGRRRRRCRRLRSSGRGRFPCRRWSRRHRRGPRPTCCRAYTFAHEQWMMRACAGPLWSAAMQLVAGRRVDLDRLAASASRAIAPWELTRRGTLMPPLAASLARAR